MKVTEKRVENSQAYLTVEVEETELDSSLEGAYKRLVQSTDIPGFRRVRRRGMFGDVFRQRPLDGGRLK